MPFSMNGSLGRRHSTLRLLATYAALTLIPVILLGIGLAISFHKVAVSRGLAEGRSEAALVARTAVEPQLDLHPVLLSHGLSEAEREAMTRLVTRAHLDKDILRLRLRDLSGKVIFSDDRSGKKTSGDDDDDEALAAAKGHTVARITRLNSDGNDDGPVGVESVEVYMPLVAGPKDMRIGVLEIYLPYGPISTDVDQGLHAFYRDLILGLAGLFLAMFVITLSVSRGLRRELSLNAFLARHDPLTELPNRALFLERAEAAINHAGRSGRPSTLAILDLNHFKDINETLGHPSGDAVLTQLGTRILKAMKPGETVARLGGDEFGLVLRDAEDPENRLMELHALIASEVEVRGLPLSIAPSIGYVTVRDDHTTVETLMQQADMAMYAAKAQRSEVQAYRYDLARYSTADLALISELRQAIRDNQLVLHYQPQTQVSSGEIVAAEALVRWQHPLQGLLPPGRFLPMAEQTDLIERVTEWVLDAVLSDLGRLNHEGARIAVAMNVSARSIVRVDFAQEVISALTRHGVSSSQLVIEVTETALLTDPARAHAVLQELSAAGIRISIDDFGQGQTSLGYLSDLPIDELKVDRGFVTDMASNESHAAIVRSVIELGHNLEMRVVAEGIEDERTLELLGELNCDLAQGYQIARPMPLADLVTRLGQYTVTRTPTRAKA